MASETDIEEKRIQEVLSYAVLLADRLALAVRESESFREEGVEVGKLVARLLEMLREVVRLTTSPQPLYDRPIRRVVSEVSKHLERALTLIRKCNRQGVLQLVCTIGSAADFRKLSNSLATSISDMEWLLSIFEFGNGGISGGIVLSLPPIASNDPILSWVWSYIAAILMGQLSDRTEAAIELASLARDNDRNKKIIIEEGGVPPLLKLLKETASSMAQIAAAEALYHIASDQERVRVIVNDHGVPLIVKVLSESMMGVQIQVACLVARMAEHDVLAQEDFARENVIRPLVKLLSFETFEDRPRMNLGKQTIHSRVEISKEMKRNSFAGSKNYRPYLYSASSSSSSSLGQNRKDRENENPEVKVGLKIACAKALWMLAKGSVGNSQRISETKGLLCLAKLVEKEQGELQFNCLMTIMEITAAAESNADLRRAAFKNSSLPAKSIVDQLLRVITDLAIPTLQIPAIKSLGSLARTFPARETRMLHLLVAQLGDRNREVATEAAIALQKFTSPENFLCGEHSKAIIELNGVPPLIGLLRDSNDWTRMHGLVLLCYLTKHAGHSESFGQFKVLTALEGVDRNWVAQLPDLKELLTKALDWLSLYGSGGLPRGRAYVD